MKKFIFILTLCVFCNTAIASTESDTAEIKNSIEQINTAFKNKDVALLKQYSSKATNEVLLFDANKEKINWNHSYTFVSATPKETYYEVALVEIDTLKNSQDPQVLLFVKEDGIWKIGIIDTIQYYSDQMDQANKRPNPQNLKSDLIVNSFKTSSSPNILDPETKFYISIKNKGAFVAPHATIIVKIKNNTKPLSIISIVPEPIEPGESKTLEIKPFDSSLDGKMPGSKILNSFKGNTMYTIEVNVNYMKEIPESNYSNNKLTKKVRLIKKAVSSSNIKKIDYNLVSQKDLEAIRTEIYSWGTVKTEYDCQNRFQLLANTPEGRANFEACVIMLEQKNQNK